MLNEKDVLATVESLLETRYQQASRLRILAYLVNTVGNQWLLADAADVIEQMHHLGKELWTASRFCSKCLLIHTRLISVTEDGSMTVAPAKECR